MGTRRPRKPAQFLRGYSMQLKHTIPEAGTFNEKSRYSSLIVMSDADAWRRLEFTATRWALVSEPDPSYVDLLVARVKILHEDSRWLAYHACLGPCDVPGVVHLTGLPLYDLTRMLPALNSLDSVFEGLRLTPDPLWNLVLRFEHVGARLTSETQVRDPETRIYGQWLQSTGVLKAIAERAQQRYELAANVDKVDAMLETATQPVTQKEAAP